MKLCPAGYKDTSREGIASGDGGIVFFQLSVEILVTEVASIQRIEIIGTVYIALDLYQDVDFHPVATQDNGFCGADYAAFHDVELHNGIDTLRGYGIDVLLGDAYDSQFVQ